MDTIEQLESLKKLLDSGAINELEFNKLKNEILGIEKPIPNTTQDVPQKIVKKRIGLGKVGYLVLAAVFICLIYLAANYFLKDSFKANTEAVFYLKKDGKYILVDYVTMKPINQNEYDDISFFTEGLAKVALNGKYGFIDLTGSLVVPFKYEDVGDFHDGLTWVQLNHKYGFIGKTGTEVSSVKYNKVFDFSEGLGRVQLNFKSGFIDKTGTEVVPLKYDGVSDFHEGLAVFYDNLNRKSGFIDKTGTVVLSAKYDNAADFHDDLAKVYQNGKYGFINKTGTFVVPVKYRDCVDCSEDSNVKFHEGLAKISNGYDKKFYINKKGREYKEQ
jgi:hypothetical protein